MIFTDSSGNEISAEAAGLGFIDFNSKGGGYITGAAIRESEAEYCYLSPEDKTKRNGDPFAAQPAGDF